MADRFDVCAPRKKKDGGTYWHKVGTAWNGAKGINIVFDSLPMPDNEGRCSVSLFEARDNRAQTQSKPASTGGGGWDELDDGAPF